MKKRALGTTGLAVSELCLGTGTFGGVGAFKRSGEVGQDEADYIVHMAMDGGINFFNTAEIYSDGLAEEILGKALSGKRNDAIVITKVSPGDTGLTRQHIIEGCEASLKRLDTDYIDIYELHVFDAKTDLGETLQALDDLVRAGKVRHIGCSNFSGWQLMKALGLSDKNGWARFTTMEAKYSLMTREVENELTPACLDQGVALLAYSPLYAGFLSGKYGRNKPWPTGTRFPSVNETARFPINPDNLFSVVDVLEQIASDHGRPVSHVALNYILQKPAVCSLITAARNAQQLEANLSAADWEMTAEEIAALDSVSEPPELHPYAQQKTSLALAHKDV
jgi:aryl-alcohol dehydrogenase-like predicted oxidoreductase